MKNWLLRFHPGSWVQYSKEEVEGDPRYGLKGRFLFILLGFFALSILILVAEMVLLGGHYGSAGGGPHLTLSAEIIVLLSDTEMYSRSLQHDIIIFAASLSIGVGILTRSWWTRYLAYFMFVIHLSNRFIYVNVHAGPGHAAPVYVWAVLILLLLRDLPLCLYLTASRRARLTLEHQKFRFDPDRPARTRAA